MRIIVLAALLAVAGASQWEEFKSTYQRVYDPIEEVAAKECFERNLEIIDKLNADGRGGRHGINMFTDMCPEDFNAKFLTYRPNPLRPKNFMPRLPLPNTTDGIDWRTKGAVTAVKNQAQCGSCWAFSSTGNMEGQWFLAGHGLVSLSEQELVSCSQSAGNMGCQGGLMDNAFRWVIQKGGIVAESTYPYTSGGGSTGTCQTAKESPIAAKFSSIHDLPKDENQLAAFVSSKGPLAIAVDASSGWQTYHGGIVSNCNGRSLDHGVLIVGYGTEGATPYWIVKNSWSSSWGEGGYIRLHKGTNQCDLTADASSIVV